MWLAFLAGNSAVLWGQAYGPEAEQLITPVQVEPAEDEDRLASAALVETSALGLDARADTTQYLAAQPPRAQSDVKKSVASAYAPVFYNNNFAYLNNPAYSDWYPGDWFKQVSLGDCWLVD